MADAEKARQSINIYMQEKEGDLDFNDAAKLQIHLGTLQRLKLQNQKDVHDTEVHVIRMGSVVFATNPCELILNFGNKSRPAARQSKPFWFS